MSIYGNILLKNFKLVVIKWIMKVFLYNQEMDTKYLAPELL